MGPSIIELREMRKKNIELPSGTIIECDGPHELCFDQLGGVINHRTRLFYHLRRGDRVALAALIKKTWAAWAVRGRP